MIYPQNIEQKIDFHVIRDGLKGCCMSTLGKERVDAMQWLTHYPTVRDLLSRVREMMSILQDASLAFPHGEIYDLREALSRIRIEGLYMDEAELFSLRKMLDYAAQLERFFTTLDKTKYPILSNCLIASLPLASGVPDETCVVGCSSRLIEAIDRILDRYGKIRDNASPELARIRKEISASQGSVSRALNAILRQAQAEGILDKDAAPTMREGRLVLPVPPAYKRKIGGIVHDESATGKTVFIEPQQVVEANNRIRELEGVTSANALNDAEFDLLRQMLSSFRTGIDGMSVEEKRAAIRTVVRKVIWDGVNVHVVLFGANEDDIEFPDMLDRMGNMDDESGEEDTLEAYADVDYEEFDENNAASISKSPWGEDGK